MKRGHIVNINIGDLKCDNSTCDHYGKANVKDYKTLLNKPCPKCGQSLLTPDDLVNVMKINRAVDAINKYLGWLDYVFHPFGGRVNVISTAPVNFKDGKTVIGDFTKVTPK